MLAILNEHPSHPGFGSVDLAGVEVGDVFYLVGFDSGFGLLRPGTSPVSITPYKVIRALKRDVYAAKPNGIPFRFSRKVFVENAAIETEAVQWARNLIRRRKFVNETVSLINRSLTDNPGMIDDDLIAALSQWRSRHDFDVKKPSNSRA